MALCNYSTVYRCTKSTAADVAAMANLRLLDYTEESMGYTQWEDRATGGGGCRIVWAQGVAWVSRHSGYPAADITEEVCFFFEEVLHCQPYNDPGQRLNPNIYGHDHWVRNPNTWEYELPN